MPIYLTRDTFISKKEHTYLFLEDGMNEREIDELYPFHTINRALNSDLLDSSIEIKNFQEKVISYAKLSIRNYKDSQWHLYIADNGGTFFTLDPDSRYEVKSNNGRSHVLNGISAGYFISQMILYQDQSSNDPKSIKFSMPLYLANKELIYFFKKEPQTKLLTLFA